MKSIKFRITGKCPRVVHQNPGTEKLVGHIGSMLERKVTDIFVTKKERDSQT